MQEAVPWHHHEVNYLDLLIVAAVEVAYTLFRQLNLAEVYFDLSRLSRYVVVLFKNLLLSVTEKHKFLSLIVSQVAGATAHLVSPTGVSLM